MRHKSHHEEMTTALAVFIRLPRAGKVKSRLAQSIGAEKAAEFYRLCAEQTFEEFIRVPGEIEKHIFFSDSADETDIQRWAGPRFSFSPQANGGLGAKLTQAFRQLFDRGAPQVIIVASDVPDLTAEVINQAISALARHDVVLGPSPDGGYYLIGLKRPQDALFEGIPWSTSDVLPQTLRAIDRQGLTVGCLPWLRDIDTATDLRNWLATAEDDDRKVLAYARAITS
jgi:uncharacterized protein